MGIGPGREEELIPESQGLNLGNPNQELATKLGKQLLTLMVIGRSGAGKSTWINSFISYFSGRGYHDERLVAIDQTFTNEQGPFKQKCNIKEFDYLQTERGSSQAKAQTTKCTLYRIETQQHFICILDTPGLDEIGIDKDSQHLKEIAEYALMVAEINAIVYVHKAEDQRATQSLTTLINSYLSMLSSEAIKQKLVVCFTFITGFLKSRNPSAIETLKELGIMHGVPPTPYFIFKNDNWLHPSQNVEIKSLSSADQKELLRDEERDWDRNRESFKQFVAFLEKLGSPAGTESIYLAGKKDEGSQLYMQVILGKVAKLSKQLKERKANIAHLSQMLEHLKIDRANQLRLGYLCDGIFHELYKLQSIETPVIYSIHKKQICEGLKAADISIGFFGSGDTEIECCRGKKSQHVAIYYQLELVKREDKKLEEVRVTDVKYLGLKYHGFPLHGDYARLIELDLLKRRQWEEIEESRLKDSVKSQIFDGIILKNRKHTSANILDLFRKQDPTLFGELEKELDDSCDRLTGDCFEFFKKFARDEHQKLRLKRDNAMSKYKHHKIVISGMLD